MDELVEFVRARLDEDEQTARRAGGAWTDGPAANWVTAASSEAASEPAHRVALVITDGERAHIVRHDPARVLREVEAKRLLLDEHKPARPKGRPNMERHCLTCTTAQAWDDTAREANCLTLRLLALPYADHPDYRAEWRP